MKQKNRGDPFKVLQDLQENMNRLFEKSAFKRMDDTSILDGGTWKPVVDIFEDESEFVINAELPGLSDKDVEIKVDNNVLMLSGDKKFPFPVKEENIHRLERVYGCFRRDFALSNNVDVDRIEASFVDGLLSIILPKTDVSQSKKINIVAK